MDDGDRTFQTSIRVTERTWLLLRALAERRAIEAGGKASCSAIVTDLIEREAARQEQDRG